MQENKKIYNILGEQLKKPFVYVYVSILFM